MKQLLLFTLATILSLTSFGQTYNNPGGTISTCSGSFNDTGGPGGQYGTNENITTTFCSSAGNCVQVQFTSFQIDNGWHFLTIYDGPNTGSTVIGTYTGGTSPGTVTSTTGCLTFQFTSDAFIFASSTGWTANISCTSCPASADYLAPTAFTNGEKVGACLVTDCGPFTYADNGNLGGNYTNNVPGIYSPVNAIYRIFCPDQANNCMQVTFNSFNTEANFDFLWVRNGPTEYSPNMMGAPTSGTPWGGIWDNALHGNLNGSTPFTFTSTDASGCLGFAFLTDGSTTRAGWDATLQCVPCAGGPNGTDNNDCVNMTPLCAPTTIAGNATGPGLNAEGCTLGACPAGGENHTNWYTFTAQTSGTIQIMINPTTGTDDYDFAIYGPNATCASLGAPLRCTDSGMQGQTGLTTTAGDNTEDVMGDSYLQEINAIAGQSFILVVDEWSANAGSGYDLTFGGTASLDCTILPAELVRFEAEYAPDQDVVDLLWITDTERYLDYFEVQHSIDGVDYKTFETVDAVGTTTYETQYITSHNDPHVGNNFYRLKQVDDNGVVEYSEIKVVNLLDDAYDIISVVPNPTSDITEIIFNCYSKGESNLKVYDARGNVISDQMVSVVPGGNRAKLDLSSQSNGMYIVVLTTNHKSYTERIIKK